VIASYIFQNAVALNLKGFHGEKEATSLDWMGLVCRNIWRATVNHLPKLFSFDIISFFFSFSDRAMQISVAPFIAESTQIFQTASGPSLRLS
jgi:hypothetical protein